MSLLFPQRFTLRRLHQTVHRNIYRQHLRNARHESSKSDPKSRFNENLGRNNTKGVKRHNGAVQEMLSYAYGSIQIPFRVYSGMQARSPYMTQLETSLVIYFLGDLSAQCVQTNLFSDGRYEPIRALRAMVIGGISSIPSYKWFLWLGRNFNYAAHWKSLAAKIVVSQMLFTPVFNTYFFGMQTLLAGGSFKDAKERIIRTVPVSWQNSWKLWPMVTAFSFTFIRPQNRNAFAGIIAVFWQTYLSYLNRLSEAVEATKKADGARLARKEPRKVRQDAAKKLKQEQRH